MLSKNCWRWRCHIQPQLGLFFFVMRNAVFEGLRASALSNEGNSHIPRGILHHSQIFFFGTAIHHPESDTAQFNCLRSLAIHCHMPPPSPSSVHMPGACHIAAVRWVGLICIGNPPHPKKPALSASSGSTCTLCLWVVYPEIIMTLPKATYNEETVHHTTCTRENSRLVAPQRHVVEAELRALGP